LSTVTVTTITFTETTIKSFTFKEEENIYSSFQQHDRMMVIMNIIRVFKENVSYPVWTCRDRKISILETRIGSLKHL